MRKGAIMTNLLTNPKLSKIIDISKCIFLCIFTVYLVTREIYPLHYFIDSFFITGFFMGMSVLYIGYDLLTNRFCLKTRYFPIALIFLFVTVISCIINREYGIFSNIKGIATLGIYLFLLYPEAFKDKSEKTFSACLATGFFSMSFFSLASLPMYIYNIDLYCYRGDIAKDQGFNARTSRLWGLFQDPNYLALFSLIAIFSSIYLFTKTKSVFYKIVLIFLNLIHIIVLSMTGSNMGIIALIAALCWLSIIIAFKKLSLKTVYRILAFILAIAISVAAPLLITKSVNNFMMPAIKKTIIHAGGPKTYLDVHMFYDNLYKAGKLRIAGGFTEEIDMSKFPFDELNKPVDRVDGNPDISNGRFDRWIDGLKLIASQPLFGLSPRNIIEFAQGADIETLMGEKDSTIHNTYLELIAGAGIIGGIFILGFLIFAAIFVIKAALQFTPNIKTTISTTLILIISMSAIALPDIIFFQLTFAGLAFWLSLGYCLNTDKDSYKNSLTYKLLLKCFKRKPEL